MNEIKCPNCGTVFQIDEQDYQSIVKQVRDSEFLKEIDIRDKQNKQDKESAIKLREATLSNDFNREKEALNLEINELKNKLKSLETEASLETNKIVSKKDLEISELKNQLKAMDAENSIKTSKLLNDKDLEINELNNKLKLKDSEKALELKDAISEKEKEIDTLTNQLEVSKNDYLLKEKNLKDNYEEKLKNKEEQLAYYKDFKARQSTKMIGESLEQHCSNEFNKLRPLFGNVYFEKDNDARTGSKGDFIFREESDDGTPIISIMFEMKNEADETSTKHKNEDFFKELDKDRKEKNCEYAVLVSLLEIDSEYYNTGIVDVSHRYPKMYVIRPQFFIPLITLLRNSALNALDYKKQLVEFQNEHIDISHFEDNMNAFKEGFGRNYRLASERFNKAIEEIDKTIDHLQKTKDALLSSENNLRLANNKAEDLTIRKLTSNSPTVANMFNELKDKKEDE